MNRKSFVRSAVPALLGSMLVRPVLGQEAAWPSRPIRWIVPYAPGAGTDTTARILVDKLSAALGQPIVIDNRGGAGGAIGTDAGAKAAPDGYTWTFGSDPPFTINPSFRKLPFDPQKDFVPVSLLARVPLVLVVNPAMPATTIAQLVALARSKPGQLTVSSSGNGSSGHLAAEYFKSVTGTDMLHVPYKGQAEAVNDVVAGRVDINFSAIGNVLQYAKAGRLRIVGIAGSARFAGLPEVPTIAESGYPGFEISAFHGLLMPAGTPPAIVARVNDEVSKLLALPDVANRMLGLGFFPVGGPPDELERLIRVDTAKWEKLIRSAGIKAD